MSNENRNEVLEEVAKLIEKEGEGFYKLYEETHDSNHKAMAGLSTSFSILIRTLKE